MDELFGLIDEIVSGTNQVADSSGIIKCVLIGKIFDDLKNLEQKLQAFCGSMEEENARLKSENEVLKTTLSLMQNQNEKE